MPDKTQITVDILSRSGTAQGPGPLLNCISLSWTYKLNAAGTFTASFPHTDERLSWVSIKGSLLAFYVGGEHVFTGVAESWRISTSTTGRRIMLISGRDLLAELAEAPVGFLELSNASAGVTDGPADILTAANTFNGTTWSLDTTDGYSTTTGAVYAKFAGESALAALVMVAEQIGEHFRVITDGTRKVVWMRTDTPTASVRCVQSYAPTTPLDAGIAIIESLTEERDGYKLFNRIYPYGGGVGDTRLDLSACTESAPANYTLSVANNYIESDDSITALGKKIGVFREFKDIRPLSNTDADLESAANFLFAAALEYLQRMDDADDVRQYAVTIREPERSLTVGDQVLITYIDNTYEIDEYFVVQQIRRSITPEGREPTMLVVGPNDRAAHSEAEQIAGSMERGVVFSAHPQLNANSYTTGYRVYVGEDQADEKAEIRFWFGDEVVQLQQVLLRFNLAPIVSFSQVAAGDVDYALSTELTVPEHQHVVQVTEVGSFALDVGLQYSGSEGFLAHTGSSVGNIATFTLPDIYLTDAPATVYITGTLDLSGAITNDPGIYRESGANTFAIGDLEYQINGGGWADLDTATSLGSAWYELDITADLYDSTTKRPDQALNLLEIRRLSTGATGKTAMIDALLSVRNIIQSINYI